MVASVIFAGGFFNLETLSSLKWKLHNSVNINATMSGVFLENTILWID